MYDAMDRLAHLEYQLPRALDSLEWMRTVRVTAPFDFIRAGSRTLHGLTVRPRIDPITVVKAVKQNNLSDEAKAKANEWETALTWQYHKAVSRAAILMEDIPRSALMYDEVVGQVIHLPSQIKAIEDMGGNAARQKAAKRYGDFAIDLQHPKNVHVRYSKYMPEQFVLVTIVEPQSIVDFWGEKASKLKKLLDAGEAADHYILVDDASYDGRAVFCYPGDQIEPMIRAAEEKDKGIIEIVVEDLDVPFLPWFGAVGGTVLDTAPEKQRFPLLYGIWKSEQWVTANILASLGVAETIAEAARPDFIATGPSVDDIEVEYVQPGGLMKVPLGNTVTPTQQRTIDPAIREAWDRFVADMGTTLPRILVTADALPDEPFAGYNMRLKQALASLIPYKHLAERATSQIYEKMLLWCHYSGVPIKGYHEEEMYQIEPEDIDPDAIYLTVELQPDVAIDQQQRTNTAVMQARELRRPMEDILQEMGETDPQGATQRWMKEQLVLAEFQGMLQGIQAEASGAIQQAAMQMAQEMLGQMQQQQQQMGQMQEQMPMAPTEAGLAPGLGMGFNPNEGGQPFSQAMPGATREMQSGLSRTGEAL